MLDTPVRKRSVARGAERPATRQPSRAGVIVRTLLSRFGDRRFVHRIVLTSPPPITLQHLRGYYAGARPPADALWAYVGATSTMLGQWEASRAAGALRDDFCAAGGRPLVGWTTGRGRAVGMEPLRLPLRDPRRPHRREDMSVSQNSPSCSAGGAGVGTSASSGSVGTSARPSSSGIRAKSDSSTFSIAGVYSAAAGWYSG